MFSTYLVVALLIVVIFFTAKLWMWIYKNAFWVELNKKIIFISLFVWWIAAFSILWFPKIAAYFWLASFTDHNFTWKVLLIFMVYLNLLILLLSTIIKSFSIKQLLNLIVFDIFFVILFAIFKNLDLDVFVISVILYYLFVAYGEEFIKNQLAFIINNKTGQLESDLLLYHILVAIGFAFWENIVYLTWSIGFGTFVSTLFWWLSIVLLRWILWFWAHTFYSSLVWMWNILWFATIFVFILVSMLVHYWYDLALYFNYKFVIPLFIVLVYIWVSYIFYKVDRLYIE